MIGIYKITNPKNKIYIGQSVNLEFRLNSYRSSSNKSQPRIFNSLKKYGVNNHFFEVIEECKICELNNRERYWQDHYDALSRLCLNCRLTKSDDRNGRLSEKTKKLMIQNKDLSYLINNKFRKGIPHSEEIQKDIDASTCNIILLDTLNGIYYNSIKQASKELNINYNTLKSYITGSNRNKTNLIAV